jgi:hypothetical protein
MPDLRFREVHLPEVHLPELHLPEMSRDDIVRAVGDARRDIDLSRFDPRRFEMPSFDTPKLDLSRIDLSKVDVPKTVATAAQAAGLVRATRRPRLPFILGGLVTLAIVGFALANSPVLRPRLEEIARRARQRLDERRAAWRDGESTALGDIDDVPTGNDAAMVDADRVGIAIDPTAFSDRDTAEMASLGPDDLVVADDVVVPLEIARN